MLKLPANTEGRDYYVGDIHGHGEALWKLLDAVHFDDRCDRLFCTGDLVDRGPDSERLLRILDDAPWFHAVMGNHEAMLIVAGSARDETTRKRWSVRDSTWFFRLPAEQRKQLVRIAMRMPLAIEVAQPEGEPIGLIHADLPLGKTWAALERARFGVGAAFDNDGDTLASHLLWGRSAAMQLGQALSSGRRPSGLSARLQVEGVQLLVSGHTPMLAAKPRIAGKRLFLDTGVYLAGGRLTLTEPLSRRYWQTNANAVEVAPPRRMRVLA
ncbi:serine/threonine protein phosphatase [Stagnimonas aquatica]|uniref:Serine/threonine protein phosphatase n=1 Tax=Stagnimonas aquatica TaxID=2689987 RepID=A0A3N0V5B3_9GAMM|nr:metallophosphoesterase [Stagnimonas aquatica]ROH87774.1 serine/threonine protein phosphatase [Stagnimonas aquatica]